MNEQYPKSLKLSFDKDGYVYLPGFLSPEEVKSLNAQLQRFIAEGISAMSAAHYFYEDKNDTTTLKQMQDLEKYDPYFKALAVDSKFEAIARTLLDENVVCKTVEYFNKPPKIGKATPPHQDGYYFMLNPQQAVTMWLALEKVDEENGCVRYVKGSHLKGMRRHGRTSTLGFSQQIVDFGTEEDMKNEIAFPASPGDLLVHHSLTIHRAGANTTANRTRKAMGLIYWGESAKEDKVAKERYMEQLAKEREKM
ncbi:phytanoyl-CoA dioxygenase family protein [Agriterribacter sp.]|uniref:phytanoyl-CoA dioxygenase family protein n=1 Tax=Agriterribacter sp. TaxID=2821509 RepID=UPI002C23A301|nr:phytanoyl-CoA dioxygenase family protein [Agriterribacter sp.]HRP57612.1 phytanoyl-CoA dioxygenase family protein [Agriterribacter sp.]